DYGTTPLLPADKIPVLLPNENIDDNYRMGPVEYYVDAKAQTLEITLELGKVPPFLADYLYGMRATTVTVEKLARTKLGKKGIPSGAWGGGIGAHHTGHEVGDQSGSPWPSEDDGGWDPIKGWIAPSHIGPKSDTAAIVYFRTKNKAGTSPVDHHFNPSDHEHGILGSETERWLEIWVKYLDVSAQAKLAQLNIGEEIVITSARVLQNVLADAVIITSGNFAMERMPRGDDGKFLRAYGAGYDPMYAFLAAGDIPSLPASKITSGQFPLGRMPRGGSGYVLEAQGVSYDPMYVNPNGRYTPASHSHSHASLTGIGPNDHHAQNHNHAGETLSPDTINVNNLNVAVGVNCSNWLHADVKFENEFRITEAEKLGLSKGLAFLNPKGKVLMFLDMDGNVEISGKLKEGVMA
ncbi:MAG: hypothetical protein OEY81_04735, partial [Candidatus Bathyarchaeota archaeon]|nr:hypothetical protein [Candidatus Bathyarchaeota archaeon]